MYLCFLPDLSRYHDRAVIIEGWQALLCINGGHRVILHSTGTTFDTMHTLKLKGGLKAQEDIMLAYICFVSRAIIESHRDKFKIMGKASHIMPCGISTAASITNHVAASSSENSKILRTTYSLAFVDFTGLAMAGLQRDVFQREKAYWHLSIFHSSLQIANSTVQAIR